MKNVLGRNVDHNPYQGALVNQKIREYKVNKKVKAEVVPDLKTLIAKLNLQSGQTLSFHHHLRNGDFVLHMIIDAVAQTGVNNLHIAASSIFPCHAILVDLIKNKVVTDISSSYISGPVAKAISEGLLTNKANITTHGGRARAILEGDLPIDIAFIAAPAIDLNGQISGSEGQSACGSLGYAVPDARCAKIVVAVTDNLVDQVNNPDIEANLVDYILVVDKIGDPKGIVSGTTKVTRDPIGLKIAQDTANLIEALGMIKDGFSFQTGAGGISLAVAEAVKELMQTKQVKGSFGCGGITGYLVNMLEESLFAELYDVQCFDIAAVQSIAKNANHHKISASQYANPNDDCVAAKLDCVILGASEIDKNFNINVTTGSDGMILGGSGGHADTATGAKVSIITSKLYNARRSVIVDEVNCITTPGDVVDVLVTEYGIAINPNRQDLLAQLKNNKKLKLLTIEELYDLAISFTGQPKKRPRSNNVVAYSVYRDGTILDELTQIMN